MHILNEAQLEPVSGAVRSLKPPGEIPTEKLQRRMDAAMRRYWKHSERNSHKSSFCGMRHYILTIELRSRQGQL